MSTTICENECVRLLCNFCVLTNLPVVAHLFLQNISCRAVIMCMNVTHQHGISAGLVHTFPSPLYQLLHACMTLPNVLTPR